MVHWQFVKVIRIMNTLCFVSIECTSLERMTEKRLNVYVISGVIVPELNYTDSIFIFSSVS